VTASFDKLKVVVIEDNNHMRMLLLSLLHAFGVKHTVGSDRTAPAVRAGADVCRSGPPA
jgi:hypothetical protein